MANIWDAIFGSAIAANFVLASPNGSAGPLTPRALVFADLPAIPTGTILWSQLGNAAADLTLANSTFNTTFNQTSAVTWKWANTTAATSSVSQSSPIYSLSGRYWTGSADAEDLWTIQSVQTNGTNGASKLTLTHTGSASAINSLNVVGGSLFVFPNWQIGNNLGGTVGGQNFQSVQVLASGHGYSIFTATTAAPIGMAISGSTLTGATLSTFGSQCYFVLGGDYSNGAAAYTRQMLFAPTSGATKFVASAIVPHINETSTNTSDYTLLQLTSIEQAFLGTNALFVDYQIASPITNASESAGSVVTLTVQNNKAVAGQTVFLEGLNTFTWLNGVSVVLTTASATSVTFTDPTTHGTQASVAQVGRMSLSVYTMNTLGVAKKYAGIPTVSQGMPAEYATVDLTAQTADIGATTMYAVPAAGAGMYRVSVYIVVSQAATTSSTLPKVQIKWTDNDNNTVQTSDVTVTNSGNALTTFEAGVQVLNAKASTNIQYVTTGTATSGATPLNYALHLKLEAM